MRRVVEVEVTHGQVLQVTHLQIPETVAMARGLELARPQEMADLEW
jgi:hypothetical protein